MNYAVREVELNHITPGLKRIVKDTLKVFRDAVKMLSDIAMIEWDELKGLNNQDQLTYMEELVHSTKYHQAKYPEFDQKFHKFPSYYRRSAAHAACGQVSSYLDRKSVV